MNSNPLIIRGYSLSLKNVALELRVQRLIIRKRVLRRHDRMLRAHIPRCGTYFRRMAMQLPLPCIPTSFEFGGVALSLLVPDAEALTARYLAGGAAVPYWARLWPAALGLCEYLAEQPGLVAGKRVLELAAGLGLPGLLAARSAESVIISDLDPDAVAVMRAAIVLNGLDNADSRVIDWAAIPGDIRPEIVLLSDVNYDPEVFETLYDTLSRFLDSGVAVVLSTPQRLMAKPFIERLLPRSRDRREMNVGGGFVSVYLLTP